MPQSEIRIAGIAGLPEIAAGDDLSALIARAVTQAAIQVTEGDIFVIAQKIVSKAEGQIRQLASVQPSAKAREWASQFQKDARAVEIVLGEAHRIVRMERGILIAETRHGFVCANAGVDTSNVPAGTVALLPEDPDKSAERLRTQLEKAFHARLAVIISDTFGRPWREGLVNVALGVSGLAPLVDYRGLPDTQGRAMQATVMAIADELASAAELVMGKTAGVPVAIVQGFPYAATEGSGRNLLRAADLDLFR